MRSAFGEKALPDCLFGFLFLAIHYSLSTIHCFLGDTALQQQHIYDTIDLPLSKIK